MKRKMWLALALALAMMIAGALCTQAEEAPAQIAPTAISLSKTQSVLGLGKLYNSTNHIASLIVTPKPSNATVNIARAVSSDESVASVEYSDELGYYLLAHKPGKAVITVVTDNGKKAVKSVAVKSNIRISSLKLSPSKMTLHIGDPAAQLSLAVGPSYCDYPVIGNYLPVTFKSSNPSVVEVDQRGYLYPQKKAGTATITAMANDGSKKKATMRVTVKAVTAQSIALNHSAVSLTAGNGSVQLEAAFTPANTTNQKLTWRSSNTKVAKVDANGLVTAVQQGTAVISCQSVSGKRRASCAVTVNYDFSGSTYRVFAIGNGDYEGEDADLPEALSDAAAVAQAYGYASFGGQPAITQTYANLTGQGILNVLDQMIASGADADDVSVFYYSGHGAGSYTNPELRGALVGVDNVGVTVEAVRQKLDQVPGTVVVILDSCLSGQFIESKSLARAQSNAFNSEVIAAFSRSTATNYVSKALTDSPVKSKYKILTACAPLDLSYSSANKYGNFTYLLCYGLGNYYKDGAYVQVEMQADADGDEIVTLKEEYESIKSTMDRMNASTPYIRQQVQVWPAGDYTAIIARN